MNARPSTSCTVRARNVSKSFPGRDERSVILKDVSIEAAPGEIISIVGRSGAGKSTFLRLLAGLSLPDEGEVEIDDVPADAARRRKTVGFLPQSPALMGWRTVGQNVEIVQRVNPGSSDRVFDLDATLQSVGLLDYKNSFPRELSGGMQHRVALARALAAGGPFLALDEPFSSLDELTRASLYDELLNLWSSIGRTIVLVTHNLDEAVLLSDRVIVLGGTPASVQGIVEVHGARPRRSALDRGDYAEVLSRLRAMLAEVSP